MTYRRYLVEKVGQIDPVTHLSVMQKPRFDFEYQVWRHLGCMKRKDPDASAEELERSIREGLRVGQAWLWPEPQWELFA